MQNTENKKKQEIFPISSESFFLLFFFFIHSLIIAIIIERLSRPLIPATHRPSAEPMSPDICQLAF